MGFAILHVEIPVTDLDRAQAFYARVFGARFGPVETVHGNRMVFLEVDEADVGASAALVAGEVYRPTRDGAVVYVPVEDLEATLGRARAVGAPVLFGPQAATDGLVVAEIGDSEGNRIALQQAVG